MVRPTPLLFPLLLAAAACGPTEEPAVSRGASEDGTIAFVGATLYDGSGGTPLANAVLLVRDGRVETVGPADQVEVPPDARTVDLTGRYVMPGMVNAHGHVGGTLGLEGGHYSEQNVLDHLRLYAAYGVTTVVSLGGDEAAGAAVRDAQDTPTLDRARLLVAGAVVTGDTDEEALQITNHNIQLGADFIKLRIDDNLGTTRKMSPEVYGAVIERAHEEGLPVAVHVFYLDDAKEALALGADFIAHSVRDTEVDEALLSAMAERDICYSPTLMREVSTFVYETTPEFFSDPFFLAHADPAVVEALQDPELQESVRTSTAAQAYKRALEQALVNLKAVSDAGVRVAMGTDSGPPRRFQGYFEHRELELMAEAGMTPEQIMVAATRDAAACMRLEDVGTLQPGKWADFLVLGADPAEDIGATRSLESVWIAGNRVDAGQG